MNLYFFVEGRRTERKVYPSWLAHLLPHFERVEEYDAVRDKNYFLISGEGYPSLLDVHLPHAVDEFNSVAAYSHLIVCLDVDDSTPEARRAEVESRLTSTKLQLEHGELVVIAQNRTIETWFLGNRRIIPGNPTSQDLADWIRFYDVRRDDPGAHGDFSRVFDVCCISWRISESGLCGKGATIHEIESRPRARPGVSAAIDRALPAGIQADGDISHLIEILPVYRKRDGPRRAIG